MALADVGTHPVPSGAPGVVDEGKGGIAGINLGGGRGRGASDIARWRESDFVLECRDEPSTEDDNDGRELCVEHTEP